VLGLTPKQRGMLYHRLWSSQEPDFVSEPHEVQQALTTVSQAIAPLKARMSVTWILDRDATEATLKAYMEEYGSLPPKIAGLLGGWKPSDEL
jgi:hypothetical protein